MSEAVNQIKIGAALDGTFDTTIQSGKRKMGELGAAAREAGKGTGAIGDGMAGSAQKVESATKNMVGSIQRQIAALEAGDKSSRQYQESLARMRGIDVAALRPYLDQLDQVKAKQAAATVSQESFASGFSAIKVGALAAASAIGAFGLAFKNIVNGVDALNDLKDATGASIENISALEDVALRTGGSFDTVSTSLIKLNKGLADAKPGSDMAIAISAIGLSVEDLKKLDPAEAFRKTAVALSGFADDANKARLTQELFGKSLKDVAPFLKDLAEQGALVAKVTTKEAEEAERFNKSLFEMQKNVTDIARDLAGPLVSAINEVIKKFKEGRAAGDGFFATGWKNYTGDVKRFWGIEDKTVGASGSWDSGATGGGSAPKPSAPDVSVESEKAKAAAKAREAALKAASKAAADYAAEIKKGIALYNDLIAVSGGLSANFEEQATSLSKAKLTTEQLTKAMGLLIAKQPFMIEQEKAASEAIKATAKARLDAVTALKKFTDSTEQQLEKQLAHNAIIGLSVEAVGELEAANLNLHAAELERQATLKDGVMWDAVATDEFKKQAQALRDLATAKITGAQKQAGAESAKSMAAEQKKAAEESGKYWEDALMRAFESGKGFFQSLWDTIKNTLKTQILKVTVQGVMGGLGLGAAGTAAASAGSSAFGSAASSMLGSSLSSLIPASFATFGNAALAGVQSMVGMVGTTAQAATAAANGIAAGSQLAAGLAPTGSTAAGLGAQFAVAAPYLGAALLAYMVINGNKTKSSADSGRARIDYNAAGIGGDAYSTTGDSTQIANMAIATNGLAKSYFDTAKSLGIAAIKGAFEVGSNTGHQGEKPMTVLGASFGGKSFSSGEFSSADKAAYALAASRAVLTALQASELPGYLAKVFDNITSDAASQEQIDATLKYAGALKTIREALLETREPLQILKDNVSAAFGDLGTSADTFKRDFVAAIDAGINPENLTAWQTLGMGLDQLKISADEAAKATQAAADAQAQIAAALAKTNQGWRDQLSVLMGSETSRSIALRDATDATTRALMKQVYAQEDLKAISEQRLGLESTLLQLQGNTTELRKRETDALDPSNRALQTQIYALQDAKTAQETYNTALANAETRFASASSALNSAQGAVDAVREKATSSYLAAQSDVASAQQRIASIQQNALKATEQAAVASAQKMRDLGKSLREFVEGSTLPADQNFKALLTKALSGDTDAMQGLSSAASAASTQAAERSSNVALTQARIMADVMRVAALGNGTALPGVTAEADPMVEATQALTKAQQDMTAAYNAANQIGASTTRTVQDLIGQFAAAQNALVSAQTEFTASRQVLEDIKQNTANTNTAVGLATQSIGALGIKIAGDMIGAFDAIDVNVSGGISPAEFSTYFAGLASESTLAGMYAAFDADNDGILTKLEVISAYAAATAASSATTATNSGSFTTGVATTVKFASDDPLFSIFANIGKTNTLLIDGLQLQLQVLRGQNIDENLQPVGAMNSGFDGTYKVATDSRTALYAIRDNTAALMLKSAAAVATPAPVYTAPAPVVSPVYTAPAPVAAPVVSAPAYVAPTPVYVAPAPIYVAPKSYFDMYKDVADAYAQNTYGMSQIEYSKFHYENFGQYEQRIFNGFAKGTNYLPNDMIAKVHEGERIIPAADNRELMLRLQSPNANNEALVSEIRALRQEVAELRKSNSAENTAIASHTANTADATRRMDKNGVLVYTDPAEPLKTQVAA